jgi:Transposase DDE domain
MQIRTNHTSSKSEALVGKIVNKMEGLKKPVKKFFISTIILFLSMRGRYHFKGMARYGEFNEMTYHNQFEKEFDFLTFNIELCKDQFAGTVILAFDPSYLPKSGDHTPHVGYYYSGCLGKPARGIEIGGLAAVSIEDNTAFHLEAIQTIGREQLDEKGMSQVDFYAQSIIDAASKVETISKILAVDGYFAKDSFVNKVCAQTNLEIISKLRKDANLQYLYNGTKASGRGRPKTYAGKINIAKIDMRRFNLVHQDEDVKVYQIICRSVSLNRKINLAYVEFLKEGSSTERYALYFSTDLTLNGLQIYQYYKARFQIEFLFRDAKQFTGLTHCQSRDKNKLYYHFNTSLSSVNIAKAAHYLDIEKEHRKSFSMADIKTCYFNELMLNLFLSNLEIDPELIKNKQVLEKLLNYGKIAC